MISQGYTPYCAGLSPHHSVEVCLRVRVCVCVYVSQIQLCTECNILLKKQLQVQKQTYSTGTSPPELEHYIVRQMDIQTEWCVVLYYSVSSCLSIISEPQQYSLTEVNNNSASRL